MDTPRTGRGHRKRKTIKHGKTVYVARAFYKGRKKERQCATDAECRRVERELFDQLKREVDGQETGDGDASLDGPRVGTLDWALEQRALKMAGDVTRSRESVARAESFRSTFTDRFAALALRPVTGPGRITVADLEAFRNARARSAAPATVNRELRELRAAIKWVDPSFKLPAEVMLHEDDLHADSLSPAEAAAMVVEGTRGQPGKRGHGWNPDDGLYWPFSAMERIYLVLGFRATELARLRRDDVRLDLAEVKVRVKGGRIERVPIPPPLLPIFRDALERQATPFVFPNLATGQPYTRTSVSRVHRLRARAALGRPFRLHDTRHHAGTTAMRAGASLPKLQQFLRLKSPKLVARYARFEREGMRELGDAVAGLTWAAAPGESDSPRAGQTSRRGRAARV